MCIQNAIDVTVDNAIERGDIKHALRMRWMSHANENAVIEPYSIVYWLQCVRNADEKKLPILRNGETYEI